MICRSSYKILRADEADDAVDQEWIERACHAVGARFQRQLIDAVMRFGGEGASLPGFEVHYVVADPWQRCGRGDARARVRGPRAESTRLIPKLALAASVPATD